MTVSHDLSLLNERPQGSSLALFSPSVDEGVISSDETSDENDPLEAFLDEFYVVTSKSP